MIIWLASYPKSGNTWIRSLLSGYFFSKDGNFNFELLKNIKQFSSKDFLSKNNENLNLQTRISKNWIPYQKFINKDKKIHFLKTHNAMCTINGNKFTDKFNTTAAIYIVRDPRNVITSIANYYNYSYEEAKKFIFNSSQGIVSRDYKNISLITVLGSWSDHYVTWTKNNKTLLL